MVDEPSEFTIVGDVPGAADLDATFASDPADILLCDAEGSEARDVIRSAVSHDAAIVVLDNGADLVQSLSGAALRGWALLPKEAEREEIRAALHAAASGLVSFDRGAALALLRLPVLAAGPATTEIESLTMREKEILQLLAEGLPNKQIAARLGISLHTVKFHVASILAKMGVQSRTEAVTLGVRQGLVTL